MEIEDLLELIELILTQKGVTEAFTEDIIKKNFVLDRETLFVATKLRQIEIVRFVLKSGVKPTLETFQYAAEHDFFELCRLFVEFGSRKILSTPELEAELEPILLGDRLENFKNLINRGTDPSADDNYSIRWASRRGNLEIVSFLLEHGADSIAKNHALQSASRWGHLEVVSFLKEKGADPTADDNKAIRWASEGGHLEVVSLLLAHGADPTAKRNEAIRLASRFGYLEIVRLLLDNGADPTAEDNYAIKWASEFDHLEIVQLLLDNNSEYKVDLTAEDNFAIKHASEEGNFKIVLLLLKHGANPTAGDNYAIKHASERDIIKLLVDYGASL
jgi:ankyrin repeat protein